MTYAGYHSKDCAIIKNNYPTCTDRCHEKQEQIKLEGQVANGGWPLAGLLTAEEKELIRAAGMDPDKLMLVWESDRSAD